jgi:hypothetical protein
MSCFKFEDQFNVYEAYYQVTSPTSSNLLVLRTSIFRGIQNYHFKMVTLYIGLIIRIYARSLTSREERRLRLFENTVLRRIFGPKKAEVTGEWRKLHNEELNDLYCSPNIFRVIKSRRIGWAEHVACMGRGEAYEGVLVGKTERGLLMPNKW